MSVEKLARVKWESSGLTKRDAQRLRLKALSGKEVARLSPSFHAVGALQIPYFDFGGKPTGFYRLRYLEPLTGFAGATKKPQRYVQPPGTLNECYLPPLLKQSWGRVLATKDTLLITEGEFKAAAACRVGFPTIGLGGVDVWRSAKREVELLPQLAAIAWKDRRVVIVFDSDAEANLNVRRAESQLSWALSSRGAKVVVARLPPASGKGLDDFLEVEGAEGLERVLTQAQPLADCEALHAMNEQVVFVHKPPMVLNQLTGQKLSVSAFKDAFATRRHAEFSGDGPPRFVSTADRWMKWPARFDVAELTYAPGQPLVMDGKWNSWMGWGVVPSKGDVGPWKRLLDFLFRGELAARQWFERWCAYPLQHPGTKLYTGCVMWGVQHGTGKTAVGYALKDIYGQNGIEVRSDHLVGSFNEWAENRQFVVGDEVTGSDKREVADSLKGLITQEEISINVKHVSRYTIPDCVNYYFTSNHPDAFILDDTDRRFFIHEVRGPPAPKKLYADFDKWRKSGGAAHLFHYLLHLPLGDFNPRAHAFETRAKREMVLNTKSDLGVWCRDMLADVTAHLRPLGESVAAKADLLTATQLLRCYDAEGSTKASAIGVGRELRRCGVEQLPVTRTAGGLHRLFAVRNAEKWGRAKPAEIAAHWDEVFGLKARKF